MLSGGHVWWGSCMHITLSLHGTSLHQRSLQLCQIGVKVCDSTCHTIKHI